MSEKEQVTLELEEHVIAELQRRADAAGCTIDDIVEAILQHHLAPDDRPPNKVAISAMEEAGRGGLASFASVEDLMTDLNDEPHRQSLAAAKSDHAADDQAFVDAISGPEPMPRLSSVRVVDGRKIEVTWAQGRRAGQVDVINLTDVLGRFKVYRPLLADDALFATARLTEEGHVVKWADPPFELTADLLEHESEKSAEK